MLNSFKKENIYGYKIIFTGEFKDLIEVIDYNVSDVDITSSNGQSFLKMTITDCSITFMEFNNDTGEPISFGKTITVLSTEKLKQELPFTDEYFSTKSLIVNSDEREFKLQETLNVVDTIINNVLQNPSRYDILK